MVGIKGYQLPVQCTLLSSILSILSVVPGSLVRRGSAAFVLVLSILRLVVGILLTFIHIMAVSIAKAALILAYVVALVGIVTVLAAMLAVVFGAFLGFGLGRGIRHTAGKGRTCILSLQRNRDLFALA